MLISKTPSFRRCFFMKAIEISKNSLENLYYQDYFN